jgi:hypothetical protein
VLLGNKDFSIESLISLADSNPGMRGLGYFVINILGQSYGIKEEDAAALACSYDAVLRRIHDRGKHTLPKGIGALSAFDLASMVEGVIYIGKYKIPEHIKISEVDFSDLIYKNDLCWAPDGDEAFDDHSRIIQLDIGSQIRLIGYKTTYPNVIDLAALTDLVIPENMYYSILEDWAKAFITEWQTMTSNSRFDSREKNEP